VTLIDSNTFNGSIATEATVMSYTANTVDRMVVVRVELGSPTGPIAGNGLYTINILINDKILVPISTFNVPNGISQAVSVSKNLTLAATESLVVTVLGQAGDTTNVDVITSIYDATPVSPTDLTGNGAVLVNHDYPTNDAMTLLDGASQPIVGACIYIYTATDYTAGDLGPTFIVGKSVTTTGGKWLRPISLDPGDYYAYMFKQGVMSPTAISFTVV
jgi:hypothetical protein